LALLFVLDDKSSFRMLNLEELFDASAFITCREDWLYE
jgi:hypothetical protein